MNPQASDDTQNKTLSLTLNPYAVTYQLTRLPVQR